MKMVDEIMAVGEYSAALVLSTSRRRYGSSRDISRKAVETFLPSLENFVVAAR
jgi:hypothetical protein